MNKKFFYRVLEGDSVFSIAQKFNIPLSLVISQNNLKNEVCRGDLLYLEEIKGNIYTVQPFDTINSIAKKFNTTSQEILQNNQISYIFYGLNILV